MNGVEYTMIYFEKVSCLGEGLITLPISNLIFLSFWLPFNLVTSEVPQMYQVVH